MRWYRMRVGDAVFDRRRKKTREICSVQRKK
jgi:hypothetical protein